MSEYVIFHIDGGIGKNIVATAVVKSVKAAYPDRKLIVVSAYPEVFLHNKNIHRIYKFGHIPYFFEDYIKNKNSIILRMEPYHSEDLLYRKKSLTEIWCDVFNIPCIDLKPEIVLTQREIMYVNNSLSKKGPILLVQPNGGGEGQQHPYSWSRDFFPTFTQSIINDIKDHFDKILVIGRQNQPSFDNSIKITDNLRNLFCYVYLADKILAIDSFVQHAAAAFDKKAVVGWICNSPTVFGHKTNDNVIANGIESFRHKIDSYLEKDDWTGARFYDCPYDNLNNIFDKTKILNLLSKKNDLIL